MKIKFKNFPLKVYILNLDPNALVKTQFFKYFCYWNKFSKILVFEALSCAITLLFLPWLVLMRPLLLWKKYQEYNLPLLLVMLITKLRSYFNIQIFFFYSHNEQNRIWIEWERVLFDMLYIVYTTNSIFKNLYIFQECKLLMSSTTRRISENEIKKLK